MIASFTTDLRNLRDSRLQDGTIAEEHWDELLRIYNEIKDWGNPNGADHPQAFLAEQLSKLWAPTQGDSIELAVDSTLTKLYAFALPDEFVIYDTRVAAAIVDIAEDLFREVTRNKASVDLLTCFRCAYPALGDMTQAARSGSNVRRGPRSNDWPQAYKSWSAQLDANRLLNGILDQLNQRCIDSRHWTLREVEAVFFMEGY